MSTRRLRFYEFGPFRIDVRERMLLRDGEIVPVTPKVFDTLLILVESSGRLLEKEVLINRLWPDSYVEECSLAQNISLLRKALGEGASRQYINTFPKRGYLFTAEVSEIFDEAEQTFGNQSESPEATAARHGDDERLVRVCPAARPGDRGRTPRRLRSGAYLLIGCAVVLSAAAAAIYFRQRAPKINPSGESQPKLIAILPFNTVGTQNDAELLGFGMADTLIIKLSNLQGFSVLPTSSVYRYTTREKSAAEIGRELGVDAVLDGTVQRSGELVRVSAQLIRVSDGTALWAAKFDERFSNIFEVHDRVAEQLAGVLKQHLSADDHARLSRRYTTDPGAYESYVIGLYFWNRRGKAGLNSAASYFKQAIEKDPLYAPAHAMLADCYYLSNLNGYEIVPPDVAWANQQTSASRALELDETLAEAHMVMAAVRIRQGDVRRADQEFRRVLDLNPSHAIAHLRYSFFLVESLELDGALKHMRMARQLDPVSPTTNGGLCYMLTLSRRNQEALKYCRLALELDPDVSYGHLNLGEAYLRNEMYDEARAEFRKMPERERSVSLQALAYAEARAGRRSVAVGHLSELLSSPQTSQVLDYNLMLIYTALGENEKALAQLGKLPLTRFNIALLKFDPQLDPLRSDPRFTSFLQSRGLRHLMGSE